MIQGLSGNRNRGNIRWRRSICIPLAKIQRFGSVGWKRRQECKVRIYTEDDQPPENPVQGGEMEFQLLAMTSLRLGRTLFPHSQDLPTFCIAEHFRPTAPPFSNSIFSLVLRTPFFVGGSLNLIIAGPAIEAPSRRLCPLPIWI
jgi:hypothetical protein